MIATTMIMPMTRYLFFMDFHLSIRILLKNENYFAFYISITLLLYFVENGANGSLGGANG